MALVVTSKLRAAMNHNNRRVYPIWLYGGWVARGNTVFTQCAFQHHTARQCQLLDDALRQNGRGCNCIVHKHNTNKLHDNYRMHYSLSVCRHTGPQTQALRQRSQWSCAKSEACKPTVRPRGSIGIGRVSIGMGFDLMWFWLVFGTQD